MCTRIYNAFARTALRREARILLALQAKENNRPLLQSPLSRGIPDISYPIRQNPTDRRGLTAVTWHPFYTYLAMRFQSTFHRRIPDISYPIRKNLVRRSEEPRHPRRGNGELMMSLICLYRKSIWILDHHTGQYSVSKFRFHSQGN